MLNGGGRGESESDGTANGKVKKQIPNRTLFDRAGRNEKYFFLIMSLLCIAGLIVLYFGHPTTGYAWMPRCPFYMLTGFYCPGCGSLRAMHYLLQGNFAESFRNHPLFLPMLICIILFYGKRIIEFRKGKNITFRGEMTLAVTILIVFIIFFIIRNIPLDLLEWTRPPKPTIY